jgi:ABC-type multidrug transport system permease subunit
MPQMFFGTFMPLGGATEIIAKFMPSKYITDALTTLFLRGAPVTSTIIWFDFAVVSIIGIALIIVGIALFERFGSK